MAGHHHTPCLGLGGGDDAAAATEEVCHCCRGRRRMTMMIGCAFPCCSDVGTRQTGLTRVIIMSIPTQVLPIRLSASVILVDSRSWCVLVDDEGGAGAVVWFGDKQIVCVEVVVKVT